MKEGKKIKLKDEWIQTWKVENASAKFHVFFIHGYSEYANLYEAHANYLKSIGASVTLFDLPGHGFTSGIRGHVESFETLLKACQLVLEDGLSEFPNIPHFLIGHSTGGMLALNLLIDFHSKIKGSVLLSPLCDFALKNKALLALLYLVLGNFGKSDQPFPKLFDPKELTNSPKAQRDYFCQPLRLHLGTPALVKSMWDGIQNLTKKELRFDSPILMLQSVKDSIVSPDASHRIFNKIQSPSKKLVWLANNKHELLGDENHAYFHQLIHAFIQKNLD